MMLPRRWILVMAISAAVLATGPDFLPAQAKAPFTIDDVFRVATLRIDDITKDGRWIAASRSTGEDRLPSDNERYGDPTYIAPSRSELLVLDTTGGASLRVFPGKEQYRAPAWSPDGKRLALFVWAGSQYRPAVWNRETRAFEKRAWDPAKAPASNSPLIWSRDGASLVFSCRAPDWESRSAAMFKAVHSGPIMVFDSQKPFLPWDEVSRRGRLSIPVRWTPASGSIVELLPETPVTSLRLTGDASTFLFERDVTEKTNYDVIGGSRTQLEALPLAGGTPRVLLKAAEGRSLTWSRTNTALAYVEKGDIFVMSVTDTEPRNLTGTAENKTAEPPPADSPKKPSFESPRFSPDGHRILATSSKPRDDEDKIPAGSAPRQYWLFDAATGSREMVYEHGGDPETRVSLGFVGWSPDGGTVYFSTSAPDRYDRGLVKLNLRTGTMSDVVRSSRLFSQWRLSEDGSRILYFESDGDAPAELFAAGPDLRDPVRLTDLNPWLQDRALSRTALVSYLDADGKELRGVLYYPANYEPGRRYPLVTEVYETYFDNGFNAGLNVLTSAGYAVLHPSVRLQTGYPGEAWMKGALAAINKVIEMGVADKDRLGIQGTSYGGYATVLLLTQTDRFKAAINNSGKVDMISFYTQSPRLGVRNTHAPEKSQDRLGGTMWEFPERYLAHSAILRADRITTPLLCITGDKDPNVEALQSQEIFIALRRLGKTCVWLRYHDGAHGGPNTTDERRDMYRRMIEWYDQYLKDAPK